MNRSTRATRHHAAILALPFLAVGCANSVEESTSSRRTNGDAEVGVPAPADYLLESEPGVSEQALTQAECDKQHIECFRACWRAKPPWPLKKGDAGHYKYCTSKCLAEYMACLAKAGLLKTFDSLKSATEWLRQHPEVVVGTVVVVAGAAFVVSTGGAGALILLPLGV